MILLNLMILASLIITITLLSGARIMINHIYFQVIITIFVLYTNLLNLIEGYKLGYIGISPILAFIILGLLFFIWGYRRNKYIYYIHNVEEQDIINIIENYLERKNINYEINPEEIYLLDTDNNIYIRSLLATTLDYRKIKNNNFYNDLVNEVKVGIKQTKKIYFSMESILYLILTLFLIWIRFVFI